MISSMPKWIGDWLESAVGPLFTITEITYVTPTIKKIRFQGDVSKMNFKIGEASVIRVSETEYRNYTPTFIDSEKGILEFIFHAHGNGAGSNYIGSLEIGDELRISVPRGHKHYAPKSKQHFIFGDETSLGLACSFLPVLKKNNHQFQFYFELDEENKNAPELLGLENYTVFSKNELFRDLKKATKLPIFQTDEWQNATFILTGNLKSAQTFRRALKDRDMNKIEIKGYWCEGKKGL